MHLLWHSYARVFLNTLAAESWPVWNPWSAFGLPLLADANVQALYPTSWLLAFVSPVDLHGPLVVLHAAFGLLGSRLLFRRLGLSANGAALGAASWALSGPLLSLVYVFNMWSAAAWMPWVLLAALAALEAPGAMRAVAWGGALALQLFAGSPDVSAFTGLLCAGLVLHRLAVAEPARRPGVASVSAIALVSFLALGAIQWLPSLALAMQSQRWAGMVPTARTAVLAPSSLVGILWPHPGDGQPLLRSHLLGLPGLALALVGATSAGAWRRPAAVVAIATFLYALGPSLPLVLLRYPEKALVVAAFAAAFLSGAGFDALRAHGPSWRRLGTIAAAASLALLGFAHAGLLPTAPRELLTLEPSPLAALGPRAEARLWVFDYFEPKAARRHLGRSDPLLIASRPAGWSAEQAAALATRDMLYPPSAAAFSVRGSYDADFSLVQPRRLVTLVSLFRAQQDTKRLLPLLRLGGVTHAVAFHDLAPLGLTLASETPGFLPEPMRVYRVPGTLPRLRLVGAARAARDASEAAAILADQGFDPERDLVVESAELAVDPGFAPQESRVRILAERPDRLRAEVETHGAAWLVQSETWDGGWQATLDGRSVPVVPANLAFRAVRVPAGRHVVEERYRPAAVRYGAVVSACAWTGAAALALRARRT